MNSARKKFIVIGDSCLDVYIYCNCVRLCPEAPVPILDVKNVSETWGMAGNTLNNLKSIACISDNEVDISFITNDNFTDITKTRYVDEKTNHMFIRIDKNQPVSRIDIFQYEQLLKEADCVIISDYNKGFLREDDIKQISIWNNNTFLDTKKILSSWAEKIHIIKINSGEYLNSLSFINLFGLRDKIVVTQGDRGAEYRKVTFPVPAVEVKDLSGAGDTFHAALAYTFTMTGDMDAAIKAANEYATKVVQKKGTSTV